MKHTIVMSGVIGETITADWLRAELKKANGDDVRIEINSPGGSVFQGQEMISIIKNYSGRTETLVTSLAASMASAFACACDKLVVTDSSTLMLHKAAGATYGNSDDMEKQKSVLEGIDNQLAAIYSTKTGYSVFEVLELMRAETWYFGREIVDAGFADELISDGGYHDRAFAIASAKSRFAAAYRAPTSAEIAAFTSGHPAATEADKLRKWTQADPGNLRLAELVDEAILKGKTEEDMKLSLTMAIMGQSLSKLEKAAAKMMGLTEAEYRRFAPR